MANMLRKASADWGFGCGRSTCCEHPRVHRKLQKTARQREKRAWKKEAKSEER